MLEEIKKEEIPNTPTPIISIDDFKKVEIRVGEILFAEPVAGSEKLLKLRVGFGDEEGKINLNALSENTVGTLIELLKMLGEEGDSARDIAYAIMDWTDADSEVGHTDWGAEDAYYMSLPNPYHAKNFFLQSPEELLLVRGMTLKIFHEIKPFVTIFPSSGVFKVNYETASETVLKAVARSFTGGQTNTSAQDADALAKKIVDNRVGSDGRAGTDDDRLIDFQDMNLNQNEAVIAEKMGMIQTRISDHLHFWIDARESKYQMKAQAEVVIDRNDLSVVQFRRR